MIFSLFLDLNIVFAEEQIKEEKIEYKVEYIDIETNKKFKTQKISGYVGEKTTFKSETTYENYHLEDSEIKKLTLKDNEENKIVFNYRKVKEEVEYSLDRNIKVATVYLFNKNNEQKECKTVYKEKEIDTELIYKNDKYKKIYPKEDFIKLIDKKIKTN